MGQEFCQNLKFRFFKNFDSKNVIQNQNFTPQNHDFDFEFGIWHHEIHFQKPKIDFSNSFRILLRDLKI